MFPIYSVNASFWLFMQFNLIYFLLILQSFLGSQVMHLTTCFQSIFLFCDLYVQDGNKLNIFPTYFTTRYYYVLLCFLFISGKRQKIKKIKKSKIVQINRAVPTNQSINRPYAFTTQHKQLVDHNQVIDSIKEQSKNKNEANRGVIDLENEKILEEERKDDGCITNLEDAQKKSTLVDINDLNQKTSKNKDAKCKKIVKLISKKKEAGRTGADTKYSGKYLVEWDDGSRTWQSWDKVGPYYYSLAAEFQLINSNSYKMRKDWKNYYLDPAYTYSQYLGTDLSKVDCSSINIDDIVLTQFNKQQKINSTFHSNRPISKSVVETTPNNKNLGNQEAINSRKDAGKQKIMTVRELKALNAQNRKNVEQVEKQSIKKGGINQHINIEKRTISDTLQGTKSAIKSKVTNNQKNIKIDIEVDTLVQKGRENKKNIFQRLGKDKMSNFNNSQPIQINQQPFVKKGHIGKNINDNEHEPQIQPINKQSQNMRPVQLQSVGLDQILQGICEQKIIGQGCQEVQKQIEQRQGAHMEIGPSRQYYSLSNQQSGSHGYIFPIQQLKPLYSPPLNNNKIDGLNIQQSINREQQSKQNKIGQQEHKKCPIQMKQRNQVYQYGFKGRPVKFSVNSIINQLHRGNQKTNYKRDQLRVRDDQQMEVVGSEKEDKENDVLLQHVSSNSQSESILQQPISTTKRPAQSRNMALPQKQQGMQKKPDEQQRIQRNKTKELTKNRKIKRKKEVNNKLKLTKGFEVIDMKLNEKSSRWQVLVRSSDRTQKQWVDRQIIRNRYPYVMIQYYQKKVVNKQQ